MVGGSHESARAARPPAFVPFASKRVPPGLEGSLVERPRLLEELLAFTGRMVVLSAPAGYGKSTLAAQWIAADPRPGAWLSLDAADNDPHVLLTYLALALDRVEAVDGAARRTLTADLDIAQLVTALGAVLAARTAPFVLVLDDVHMLEGPSLDDVVGALVDHVPSGSTLVLATRAAAPFPTSRAALRGEVAVVDSAALAMTADEADALLRAGGVDVPSEAATALEDLTEGWPAGLYMATLALRGADDPDAAARDFSGRQRRITDFFTEEVLPSLTLADVEFLLATSVLDRCSGELCDVALDRTGSGAVLERLARTNRFVIPLDEVGEWYRYHHLFAEMLRAEQLRRDPDAFRRVAHDASVWWEQRFEPDAAMTLALAASDRARAISLVSLWGPVLQNDRRLGTVDRWLAAFTDAEILADPALAVTAAWNALLAGDAAGVHRFAVAVEASTDPTTLPDGTPPHAATELLRALTTSRGLTDVRDHAATAFAEHPAGSPYRAIAALLESGARLLLGDLAGAIQPTEQAVVLGHAHLQAARAQGLANRARFDATHGDWGAACAAIDEALLVVAENWLAERPAMGIVYAAASLVHARCGRAGPADEARAHGLALLLRLEDMTPFLATMSLIELAESALITGGVDEARTLLAEADRRLRRLRDTGLLPFALSRVGNAVAAASASLNHDLVEPLSAAELRVLRFLPTHLSFGEIGHELYVSRNTVKSHAMAIYRKLGVTSRSAAVKAADEVGLITPSG